MRSLPNANNFSCGKLSSSCASEPAWPSACLQPRGCSHYGGATGGHLGPRGQCRRATAGNIPPHPKRPGFRPRMCPGRYGSGLHLERPSSNDARSHQECARVGFPADVYHVGRIHERTGQLRAYDARGSHRWHPWPPLDSRDDPPRGRDGPRRARHHACVDEVELSEGRRWRPEAHSLVPAGACYGLGQEALASAQPAALLPASAATDAARARAALRRRRVRAGRPP